MTIYKGLEERVKFSPQDKQEIHSTVFTTKKERETAYCNSSFLLKVLYLLSIKFFFITMLVIIDHN